MKFKGIERNNEMNETKKLKIITAGGTETVTKNMTIYEYDDEIVLVDCGVEFPDDEDFGVDILIPDFTYIKENSHKVKGLVITHGHEDHIGAVPFLLQEMNIPIYCTKLVEGFLRGKLSEKKFKRLLDNVSFNITDQDGFEYSLGKYFKFETFRVNHSVPESTGLAIRTPEGIFMHMADYRVDWTPVIGKPINIAKISSLGEEGVTCLLSDCLGVTSEGYSKSESTLSQTFFDLFEEAAERQVFVTTISSNISRMYQITNAAVRHGRKVVLGGRSIHQSVAVARSLGLLPFNEDVFVTEADSQKYQQKELIYIVAGCYGQQGSALDRIARSEHRDVILEENAMVIFSADPNPPGVDVAVERLISTLTLKGAQVVYSKIQQNLHVSGHGVRGDLTMIASLVRPKYFIPIGGTIPNMREYTNMINSLGWERDSVFELKEGESVEFSNGYAKLGPKYEMKEIFIDSGSSDEVDPIVVKDRSILSTEGVFVVVVPVTKDGNLIPGKVEVITRGFIYVKGNQELMEKSRKFVETAINKRKQGSKDWNSIRRKIESDIERFLYKETGRNPFVIVHSISV